MKKIVCCAAVVFGMMEVSQGMEIECKNENGIGGKMESKFDWKNKSKDEIRQKMKEVFKKVDMEKLVIPCNKAVTQFYFDGENFCNINKKEEVLYFCDVDCEKENAK